FKTSGGKYVAPQLLENEMKQSRFIEQIMIVGEGERMPGALIQPNFEFVREWAKIHEVPIGDSLAEMCGHPRVVERIAEEIEKYNEKFGNWEKVKKFELTPVIWSIEGGELTPTLKLKRKIVLEKYRHLYERIFRN